MSLLPFSSIQNSFFSAPPPARLPPGLEGHIPPPFHNNALALLLSFRESNPLSERCRFLPTGSARQTAQRTEEALGFCRGFRETPPTPSDLDGSSASRRIFAEQQPNPVGQNANPLLENRVEHALFRNRDAARRFTHGNEEMYAPSSQSTSLFESRFVERPGFLRAPPPRPISPNRGYAFTWSSEALESLSTSRRRDESWMPSANLSEPLLELPSLPAESPPIFLDLASFHFAIAVMERKAQTSSYQKDYACFFRKITTYAHNHRITTEKVFLLNLTELAKFVFKEEKRRFILNNFLDEFPQLRENTDLMHLIFKMERFPVTRLWLKRSAHQVPFFFSSIFARIHSTRVPDANGKIDLRRSANLEKEIVHELIEVMQTFPLHCKLRDQFSLAILAIQHNIPEMLREILKNFLFPNAWLSRLHELCLTRHLPEIEAIVTGHQRKLDER